MNEHLLAADRLFPDMTNRQFFTISASLFPKTKSALYWVQTDAENPPY